ncbi:hypothetical protein [Streptomyces lavendulocolor]|uniref:hypothetical protein n=1 Tax=Streptomyces lavendulocolor TaxID=67316 RepID=UPI003C30851B
MDAEHATLATLRGGCLTAASVHATFDEEAECVTLHAVVLDPDGGAPVRTVTNGPAAAPATVGRRAGEQLLDAGAARLLGVRP